MDPFTFIQVIGVAYTYRPSLAIRHHLTFDAPAYHSAQNEDFSYFFKGDDKSIVGNKRNLCLRADPITGRLARHWPEPELAVLLGSNHEFVAFTLANDLTAISVEQRGRTEEYDGTYMGKVWSGSGSLGPQFVRASSIDVSSVLIGLRIERKGRTIYDQTYSTSRRLHSFESIPDWIINRRSKLGANLPRSKVISMDQNGFLAPGTVIMLGTGLIVSERHFAKPGDRVTVYCREIGELTNPLVFDLNSPEWCG